MDNDRFDQITRSIAAGVSRRSLLAALAGAGVAISSGGRALSAPGPCEVGCESFSGPRKASCKQACKKCGGDFNLICIQEGPFGPVDFTCCPEGTFCVRGTGVCCTDGFDACTGADDGVTVCCGSGTFCDLNLGGVCREFDTCDACDVPPCHPDAGVCAFHFTGRLCHCMPTADGGCSCAISDFCGPPCDEFESGCPDGTTCVQNCCGYLACEQAC